LPPPLNDPKSAPTEALNHDRITAVDLFEKSEFAQNLFGKSYRDIYVAVRRDEIAALSAEISAVEYRYYLSRL